MRSFVVMGVAGCGKTTVGEGVAARTGMTFVDGDDLHPPENIAKMSAGTPLDDKDRAPWLARVGETLAAGEGPTIIGCSALKRLYRDWIREAVGAPVFFVHLAAPQPVIAARMAARSGHFMPTSLLDSQFAALEPLGPGEDGAVIDISVSIEEVIAAATAAVEAVR